MVKNNIKNRKLKNRKIINYHNLKEPDTLLPLSKKEIVNDFCSFIGQESYPCIGAQTALNSNMISVGFFGCMNHENTSEQICEGLYRYIDAMKDRPSSFLTYIAIFENECISNEEHYENELWDLLFSMHSYDNQKYSWNNEVSNHTLNKNFSYSIGGEAFFLVGMHPQSSRRARRFKYPAIAFNLHSQFELLRENNRFQRIKNVIRDREMDFQGSINPMLSDYGHGLEAPQYSGRKVSKNWQCPYSFRKENEME